MVTTLKSYMIAVGGAGSFGSPALASGKRVINRANPIRTAIPSPREASDHGRWQAAPSYSSVSRSADTRDHKAHKSFAGDQARGRQHPAFSTRAFCASLNPRLSRIRSVIQRITPPTEDREGRFQRQVHADGEEHRALHLEHDHESRPISTPTTISGHGMLSPTMPCEPAMPSAGLRRGELRIAETDAAAIDVA